MGFLGLFGNKRSRFDEAFKPYEQGTTPGIGDGVSRRSRRYDDDVGAIGNGFWSGNGKFTGRDALAGALAVIGDAFSRQGGGSGGMTSFLANNRLGGLGAAQRAEAKAAREQETIDKLIAAGVPKERAILVAGGIAKYPDVVDKPATPYRWEDNAGNLMELGGDGQPVQRYRDPTPRMNFIPDGMGGGRWVPLPQASQPPQRPVGKLTPVEPEPAGGGQNGQFTEEMYRGLVSSLGQQAADDWVRRNNIQVSRMGGY